MTISRRSLLAGAALTVASMTVLAMVGQSEAQGPIFTGTTPGVAINGYDPVAYHTQGKPVKGSANFKEMWKGVAWHFSSAENRSLFASNPAKYAPQYGGYCAYAVAKNSLVKTEPDAFSVVDGKLYLNFDQSVKQLWDGSQASYIADAEKNWPGLAPQ